MESTQNLLDFYRRPSFMTEAGKYEDLLRKLPDEVESLVRILQGIGIYDAVAADFYDFKVPDERRNEIHLRRVEKMLDRLFEIDDRPLSVSRPAEKRLVSRCRNFLLLLLSILRVKGVPARARAGFGDYFNPGYFEDHWVCEYWNAAEKRWILVDTQLDEIWRAKLKIDFDIFDVPRDRFLVAGDAWAKCRSGEADSSRFGIYFENLRGLWFVAGDLVRDMAALNKMEMLPWDVWGAQPAPNAELGDEQERFFDELADLSKSPDANFEKLRRLYDEDERIKVPESVFNALLNQVEKI